MFDRQGKYGSDIYTLRSIYFLNTSSSSSSSSRTPTVHLHWRRFALSSIPLAEGQEEAFERWVANCWREKDELLDGFVRNGSFVSDGDDDDDDDDDDSKNDVDAMNAKIRKNMNKKKKSRVIETEIKMNNPLEFLALMVPGLIVAIIVRLAYVVLTTMFSWRY